MDSQPQQRDAEGLIEAALELSRDLQRQLEALTFNKAQPIDMSYSSMLSSTLNKLELTVQQARDRNDSSSPHYTANRLSIQRLEKECGTLRVEVNACLRSAQAAHEAKRRDDLFRELSAAEVGGAETEAQFRARMLQCDEALNDTLGMARAGLEELVDQGNIIHRLGSKITSLGGSIKGGAQTLSSIFKVEGGNRLLWFVGLGIILLVVVAVLLLTRRGRASDPQ